MARPPDPWLFAVESPAAQPVEPEPDADSAPALYADVAVNRPMRCEFTYRVPAELVGRIAPGVRVLAPFSGRREVAVVVGLRGSTDVPAARIKPIAEVLDPEPVVDEGLLELTKWMASYYACSWGEALAAILPAALKRVRQRRKVVQLSVAEGVGATELATLAERHEKQHRLLRTLLELDAPIEMAEVLRRLKLSDSPARTLAQKGWIRMERVVAETDELLSSARDLARERPERLTPEQGAAIATILERLEAGTFGAFLLHGVTGSGKTEVYLRVIEEALAQGKGAIVLVPEIALTPQTVGWFRSRFGEIAVLHSKMTDAQRLEMWMRVKHGQARVVVGARSAVFAPVANLGVIVVDEEHENSFKQGNVPRYHGRDVAVVRAKNANAVCILGSATPSLESWENARRGRYERIELTKRVKGGRMPRIDIVDMRLEKPERAETSLFSRHLRRLLEGAFERKEQSILFMNRRGFSPVLWCRECGLTVRCSQCDVALTFHRRIDRAVCHTCCEETRPPKACPTCTAPALRFLGAGSERIEQAIATVLPNARVRRMDSDTMLRRTDYEETLDAFGRGEVDVLVGTQMIAKGLDFPRVTVVGIVSADSSLHLPDFRASERTFQLISQVSGRAGRGDLEGHIVVQTITPDHPAIVQAARHDHENFARLESDLRRELGYPPYGRLIRVVFEDEDDARVRAAADRFASALTDGLAGEPVTVLGPAPAPIALIRGRHRQHVLVKTATDGTGAARARAILVRLSAECARPRVIIDVDPVGML
ncbi:MAG: primosomal protein N' [Planctomycetota bacterium]|nr:MAG: primosomal protein N' [Planctomycetota bacterium]